jgi:V/A-type H+-transporting ATPase subunit I
MIIPMKRLDILLYHREREEFLQDLRSAGVVHISEKKESSSDKLEELYKTFNSIEKAISLTKFYQPDSSKTISGTPKELVNRVLTIGDELERLEAKEATLQKEHNALEPWGDFDPEKRTLLESYGIYSTFYEINRKHIDLFEDLSYGIIKEEGSYLWIAIISEDKPDYISGVESVVLPNVSLSEVNKALKNLSLERGALQNEMREISASINEISSYRNRVEEELQLERAELSMGGACENLVLVVEGWVPEEKESVVKSTLDSFSCWYELSEPSSEDSVPVKMKNSAGAKLFEPITKIFALPDYFELDPTPFFAPFYALFFGLCLGDLGYGAVLIILAIIGMKLMPKIKRIMVLGIVLGAFTMLSGVLLNTVFGAQIFETVGGSGFLSVGNNGFALLKPVVIDGVTIFPAMAFAVLLGMIQIILGVVLKGVNKFREGGFTYILYPIGSILLVASATLALIKINFLDMATFFPIAMGVGVESVVAQREALMQAIPSQAMLYPMILGLVLLFLFNNPDKKMGIRLPLGLWELYGFVTGLMGDALSYIRLFALGLAGGLLGKAFNDIGFMMVADDAPSFMIVFTVLILIVGHTINFALAALGSFVHPLRLTFVEFYKNLDFKGGAESYKPFAKADNN